MERKRRKRKSSHVIIVTSDTSQVREKQFRIRPWMLQAIIGILCVATGAALGYIYFETRIWQSAREQFRAREETIALLKTEKTALETELEELNDKIGILGDTVNQMTQAETELRANLESRQIPTGFPLTGAAAVEQTQDAELTCVFTASAGSFVVATADGIVSAVEADEGYGYRVTVDHGNGYVTVYLNGAEPAVGSGNSVSRGSALFVIGESNGRLGYRILKDGAYINPMDMLAISG